jgi:hypothetical protein
MTATYKAAEVTSPGKLNLVTRPVPEPGPGQVRVRVEAAGICHSDVATVDALFPGIHPRQQSLGLPQVCVEASILQRYCALRREQFQHCNTVRRESVRGKVVLEVKDTNDLSLSGYRHA